MPKEKGSEKTGGRKAGTPNKTTSLGKKILEKYFFEDDGLKNLLHQIDDMEYEKDKVTAKIKLLEFVMPKQKEIEITAIDKEELTDEELAERLKQYEQRNK